MELRLDTEDQKHQAVQAMARALVDNHYGTTQPGHDACTVLESFIGELAKLDAPTEQEGVSDG